jgi:hypothetical protein
MYKLDDESVPFPQLNPEQQEAMGKVAEEATKAGVLVLNAGIAPTSMGAKVTRTNGQFTVTDGPFTEAKEVVGGYAIVQAKDKAEAIEWTKRFLQVHEEHWTVTCEVREIAEA